MNKQEGRKNTNQRNRKIQDLQLNLSDLRILRTNMVYITGLPKQIASTKILKQKKFLAQYGKILNIQINRDINERSKNKEIAETFSAYISFKKTSSACLAILCLQRFKINDIKIIATFGFTKFCYYFLMNEQCQNKKCQFVHEFVDLSETISNRDKNFNKKIRNFNEQQITNYVQQKQINLSAKLYQNSIFPEGWNGIQNFLRNNRKTNNYLLFYKTNEYTQKQTIKLKFIDENHQTQMHDQVYQQLYQKNFNLCNPNNNSLNVNQARNMQNVFVFFNCQENDKKKPLKKNIKKQKKRYKSDQNYSNNEHMNLNQFYLNQFSEDAKNQNLNSMSFVKNKSSVQDFYSNLMSSSEQFQAFFQEQLIFI